MNTKDLLELAKEANVNVNTPVKDLLGLQYKIPELIYQINVDKYRLAITYGGQMPPIIKKLKGNIYTLNIQGETDYHNLDMKGQFANYIINKQLTLFMPVIQKFMADALTGCLNEE